MTRPTIFEGILAFALCAIASAHPPEVPTEAMARLEVTVTNGIPAGALYLDLPRGGRMYCDRRTCLGPTTGSWVRIHFKRTTPEECPEIELARLSPEKWPHEDDIVDVSPGGTLETKFDAGDGLYFLRDRLGEKVESLPPGKYEVEACIRVEPRTELRHLRLSHIDACAEPIELIVP